tara:strand:- start:3 stop:1013 length:1011 start_codon:yes stop_codon:yes gene_type:complete
MINCRTLIFITCIFLFSCKNKFSTGISNEILIVSSYEDSLYSSPTIYNFIQQKNKYLPLEEDYFKVKWIMPSYFKEHINRPLILMLKLNNPNDVTGDKLFDRIFENKLDNSKINFIKNFYALEQSIIGIEADDVIDLNSQLNNSKQKIFNEIDDKVFSLISRKYYKKPKNHFIANKIKERYNINIFIDHEYQIIRDTNNFLWLGRGVPSWGDPYRWILIKEIDECVTPLECLNIVQDTFNILDKSSHIKISSYDDVESYRYKYNKNYFIGGSYKYYDIVKNNGVNDTVPKVGGPYISYVYNNENSSILVIGLINNPGNDKMIYLKQLESIFRDITN